MASRAKVSADLLAAESAAALERMRSVGCHDALIEYVRDGVTKKKRNRKKIVHTSATAAASILFLLWAVPYFRSTATVETLPGRRQQLTLADGSRTELNARTEMRADFRYGRRIVHLDYGEAFFSVAKDPAHPFLVLTPAGTVQVTGTKFNVRLDASGQTAVTLYEGAVNVTSGDHASSAHLAPGQEAELTKRSAQVTTLTDSELDAATAWRTGRIDLDNLTVAQAVQHVADYHRCTILVSPSVANQRLGGGASLEDLAQFFTTLRGTGKLEVVDLGRGRYQVAGR